MSYDLAIAEDRGGRVEQAAAAYEEAFAKGQPALGPLMNAVVLYWQSTAYGFWTAKGLSEEFVTRADERMHHFLTLATTLYPDAGEPRFWQKYIDWADSGEDLSPDCCRQLLLRDPNSLVPAMYLFSVSNGQECVQAATRLLEQCREEGTVRAEYIASVLEAVLKRRRW